MKVGAILEQIDLGKMALPEFQRGYVWNREQVRGLMESLYRRYPVGGLLIWETNVDHAKTRGNASPPTGGWVDLLLDGQQRMTSLYGIIRGNPPKFFDGNAAAFMNLYFNMAEETFEFYAPLKMQDNPVWVSVSKLMQTEDVAEILEPIEDRLPSTGLKTMTCLSRLNRVQGIREVEFHIDRVSGPDKSIDVVVEIFNRVNSGGTTLSKGDLALAKMCAAWPDARNEMKLRLSKWRTAGYPFKLEWYLRCITAITTGEAFFSSLAKIDTSEFQDGVGRAEQRVDRLLNTISGRLGLDHGDVLGSPYSFPLMCRYLDQRDGHLSSSEERDRLLYWYVHTFLWGRYAGSTESVLSQDLRHIDDKDGALDRLIDQLRQNRGDLRIQPNDFRTWSRGSRFYPLLYMMTRVYGAQDLESGLELRKHLLGNLMRLELHHIFPKAKLYRHNFSRPEVNALGNFMFLTQETNLLVTDRDPEEYLPQFEEKHPGVLASQWIPQDPLLWKYENYRGFLAERRVLLAQAANDFLDSLNAGTAPESESIPDTSPVVLMPPTLPVAPEDEESQLLALNEWVVDHGLPEGDFYVELLDAGDQNVVALIDLAWPSGIQSGYSQPVAVLLNEGTEVEEAVNQAGYRFFTDVDAFKRYVMMDVLAMHLAAD
jgi:hypothetical protein